MADGDASPSRNDAEEGEDPAEVGQRSDAEEDGDASDSVPDSEDDASAFAEQNPMMDRLRLTLHEQLVQTRDRVKLELIEQEEALREAKRSREDAGIELYGQQQQLSRLQTSLRAVDERTTTAMKSEVAVTRTVANKTKEDLKARAKSKLDQDTYIDGLNTQVTRLEDEIALTEAQLTAQKEQSADADQMIRETSGALDKLAGEQKRLVQQWNSSVVALGRRDQALAVATKALKKVQDSIQDLDNENARLERDIAALQEGNEGIRASRDRLDNEIVFTETNIARVQENLGSLAEKFELLQESLKSSNQEEKSLELAVSKIESEISTINHRCELLIRERHAIEEKISTTRHEQMSMSKVAQTLAKEERSVLAKIHDKEIESATILNEIARLDIDRLNTQAHNSQLEDKLKEELTALRDAETKIDEQEGEIRRCNDEIEKKTLRVAKLNREYNKMVEGCDDEEPLGPLEATIKSLSKEIERETTEIRGLQREWLMRQTELIKTISKTNAIQEKDGESTSRLAILRQKLLRLSQEIHTNEASLRSVEYKTRGLHTDITRLNDLIEQNSRRQADYANKMAVSAMECERELAELDQESDRLEGQIAEVQSNREKLLDEIQANEEQLAAWEKKIRTEKETEKELTTSKDAIDTKGMEKEIQRMRHRLESLLRSQEQLLKEMEIAIHKREDIAVKYKNNKGRQQQMTKGELNKRIEQANTKNIRLQKSLQQLLRDMELAIHKREDIAVKYKNTKCVGKKGGGQQSMTKGELNKRIEQATAKNLRLEKNLREARDKVSRARDRE
ncbi:hypothetical protein ACHAXT_005703 [Thalassiosira profunda]